MKRILIAATILGSLALTGCTSLPHSERFQPENYEAYGQHSIAQYYHPFSHLRNQTTQFN